MEPTSTRWSIGEDLVALGRAVRRRRRRLGLTQAELAGLSGVGVRFVVELERGKPGLELGRALHVMQQLGLELRLHQRSAAAGDDAHSA